MGTQFRGLMMMDMFMNNGIRGYKIIHNVTKLMFCWDLKFVDCPTHEIHKIKCPMNKNDSTVSLFGRWPT